MSENNNNKPFLLVSGDFSGIQDTVYTISSKGALKSLRARSFMLELLTEHIVYEILKLAGMSAEKPEDYLIRLGKTKTGVIFSGGGAFSLLLTNKDNLKNEITDFANILNEWSLNEFAGKLFIAIHALEVLSDDLEGNAFLNTRQKQADELDKLKRRKFWNEDGKLLAKLLTPEMPKQLNNEDECQITRRDDLPDIEMKEIAKDFWVSQLSFHLWHLGDNLTDFKDIRKIYRYDYQSVNKKELKGYLHFPKPDKNYALYTVEKIDSRENYWEKCWELGKDFYYAYYVRKVDNLSSEYAKEAELKVAQETQPDMTLKKIKDYTASFAGLAASSCGADLIGALRMDVDNLGKLFSEIRDYRELATRSHDLNFFFKVILNQICEGDFDSIKQHFEDNELLLKELPTRIMKDNTKERTVSIVYAGGDDLFIVGAWNEVAELAFDIQKCFSQYCKKYEIKNEADKQATISGGLTLHHPKYPLYQMADRSGQAEKEAKTWDDNKSRIALFHDEIKVQRHHRLKDDKKRYMLSMSWKTADEYLLPLMNEFANLGKTQRESKRRTFAMDKISHQTIEKWFLVTEKYQQSGELYMPTMARVFSDLKRNLEQKLFDKLMKYLYQKNNPEMAHLHIALNWLSFLRRIR